MTISVRPATTQDVVVIERLIEPFVQQRILLGKDPVVLYESIQQFVVAEEAGEVVGCGALHVMWSDLGEIRTVAVGEEQRGWRLRQERSDDPARGTAAARTRACPWRIAPAGRAPDPQQWQLVVDVRRPADPKDRLLVYRAVGRPTP